MRRAVSLVSVLALFTGCASGDRVAGEPARLQIVTTVAPLTSIVAAVAGDRADIAGLVPEGTNSHTFEPPPSAAARLAKADVLFLNGLGLEDPTRELAEASLSDSARTVLLGDLILDRDDYIFDFSFPRAGGRPNPHTWTDPPLAIDYAVEIETVLSHLDPEGADEYRANLDAFTDRAQLLDRAMRTASATVPVRKLLTYHDAYAYFAETYDWEVIGAIQVSDFGEPKPGEVAALIRQVREHRVPAIFGSEVFPSPVLEQIGREAGVRYVDTLRDDDLPGDPGDTEHSWLGLMRQNFITMVEALGGDAAPLVEVPLTPALPDDADYPQ
ncbi:MAG TPA: metal ABC transporter substrate-binding protein [Acidimicrobiales bacterium]|nr:metal ABC transporter substrate-binding protein [Acidimicrobiales bacterium]